MYYMKSQDKIFLARRIYLIEKRLLITLFTQSLFFYKKITPDLIANAKKTLGGKGLPRVIKIEIPIFGHPEKGKIIPRKNKNMENPVFGHFRKEISRDFQNDTCFFKRKNSGRR